LEGRPIEEEDESTGVVVPTVCNAAYASTDLSYDYSCATTPNTEAYTKHLKNEGAYETKKNPCYGLSGKTHTLQTTSSCTDLNVTVNPAYSYSDKIVCNAASNDTEDILYEEIHDYYT